MSTPTQPHAGTSLSPTRQQLDELEALMRRMLDLPVNHLEENPAPAAVATVAPPKPRVESDLDRILAEFPAKSWPTPADEEARPEFGVYPPPVEENIPEEAPDEMPPAPLPDHPVAEDIPQAPETPAPAQEPVVEAPPVVVEKPRQTAAPWMVPPPVRREPPAVSAPPPAPSAKIPDEPPVPLVLRPLVWANDAFDAVTLVLGPAGRWLRGRTGRALLGLAGLLLLAMALAWGLLDWFAWTW